MLLWQLVGGVGVCSVCCDGCVLVYLCSCRSCLRDRAFVIVVVACVCSCCVAVCVLVFVVVGRAGVIKLVVPKVVWLILVFVVTVGGGVIEVLVFFLLPPSSLRPPQ